MDPATTGYYDEDKGLCGTCRAILRALPTDRLHPTHYGSLGLCAYAICPQYTEMTTGEMEICVLSVLPVCAKQALTPTIPSDWQPAEQPLSSWNIKRDNSSQEKSKDAGIVEVTVLQCCLASLTGTA